MDPRTVTGLHRKAPFDLILLDLQMPDMDGFQVMEGLKANAFDDYIPVLVITAQPGHKLRALQSGAKDFVSKPFDMLEVRTRIHNLLEVRLLHQRLANLNHALEQEVLSRTAELRESEARYRALTELAPDWYWEQDNEGRFTKVSGPVLEMLGCGWTTWPTTPTCRRKTTGGTQPSAALAGPNSPRAHRSWMCCCSVFWPMAGCGASASAARRCSTPTAISPVTGASGSDPVLSAHGLGPHRISCDLFDATGQPEQGMTFHWTNPTRPCASPVMARNVVSTSHPLASSAGLRMLLKGGNAVDAVIAAAAALTIVEPISNGLGSDNFAILWDGEKLHGLNSSGVAPATWKHRLLRRRHGGAMPQRGWDSVTTPGAVAGWVALSERFGQLPFADLLEPAIELAERGHGVGCITADKWARQVPFLKNRRFCRGLHAEWPRPRPGERFTFKAAGATLRKIADTRGEAYYRGEIAEALVAHAAANGGTMTLARPRRLPPRVGDADPEDLCRPHGARDPAQRAGHRPRSWHSACWSTSTSVACRWTASKRSTCRSKPSSSRLPTPTAGWPMQATCAR